MHRYRSELIAFLTNTEQATEESGSSTRRQRPFRVDFGATLFAPKPAHANRLRQRLCTALTTAPITAPATFLTTSPRHHALF